MWPNNGFGNQGPFPDDFHSLGDFPSPSPFATGFVEGYLQQANPTKMQYNNSDGFHFNNMQLDLTARNEGALTQNGLINTTPPVQFPPSTTHPPPTNIFESPRPKPNPQINARAAELKARLMRGKQARSNSTAPSEIHALPIIQPAGSDLSTLPLPSASTTRDIVQDIETLISEASEANPAARQHQNANGTTIVNSVSQQIPTKPNVPARCQNTLPGSLSITSKSITNDNVAGNYATLSIENRQSRQGSEMSEGEILDEPEVQQLKPVPTEAKKLPIQQASKVNQSSWKSRDEALFKPAVRETRSDSPQKPAARAPIPQAPRAFDEREDRPLVRRESLDARQEKNSIKPETRQKRNVPPELDRQPFPGRDSRDDSHRRSELIEKQKREEAAPTLEKLLPYDRDLREWLRITGYHNAAYRDKILDRRRKLAVLDAQREQLLAEMAAAEREAPPRDEFQDISMPLPPISSRQDGQPDHPSVASRDLPFSNKRPFSEFQDSTKDVVIDTISRSEDRRNERTRERELEISRRPRSRDAESGQNRDERDNRLDDRRPRRTRSRERNNSPGRWGYDGREPLRTRSFDDEMRGSDYGERYHDPSKGYQGKHFDPTIGRGRGRGRGRGGYQGNFEPRNDSSIKIAAVNGKSFNESRGFEKGRNGGQ